MTGSGNCVIAGDDGQSDVHRNANKLFDSSVSCTGNEESPTKKEELILPMCSTCVGVAYAVNHFPRRTKL